MNRLWIICIVLVSAFFGAYFIGNIFAGSVNVWVSSNQILSQLENDTAEEPENVFQVLADTRKLLASTNKSKAEIERAQMRLDRATDEFFKKNIDAIALRMATKDGPLNYRKAFDQIAKTTLKADISERYRQDLRKNLLAQKNIMLGSEIFKAYAYVVSMLYDTPKTLSGSLDSLTMRSMLLAEKGILTNTGLLVDDQELERAFRELGYQPWKELDMRTMRRTITTEGLSTQTRFTRAYLTAEMLFGRNALGKRIYLRQTLKHAKQFAGLSCEANSFSHFYNFYAGLAKKSLITEQEAFALFPKDERLPELEKTAGGKIRIWGDPETVFVGKVEGIQSVNINKLTGYGIHAAWVLPVLKAQLAPLGYTAMSQDFSEYRIVWSLSHNQPLLFWYVLSDSPKDGFSKLDWQTWDGKKITGFIGEHTGILVGAELSKSGELLKVAYYEGRSEGLTWEDWSTLRKKASYFNVALTAEKK